jgi:hypothetical protein
MLFPALYAVPSLTASKQGFFMPTVLTLTASKQGFPLDQRRVHRMFSEEHARACVVNTGMQNVCDRVA